MVEDAYFTIYMVLTYIVHSISRSHAGTILSIIILLPRTHAIYYEDEVPNSIFLPSVLLSFRQSVIKSGRRSFVLPWYLAIAHSLSPCHQNYGYTKLSRSDNDSRHAPCKLQMNCRI